MNLTVHQRRVLDYIRRVQRDDRYSPSLNDIKKAFGHRSHSAAAKTVAILVHAGEIRLDPRGRICFATIAEANRRLKLNPRVRLPAFSMGRCYLFAHAAESNECSR